MHPMQKQKPQNEQEKQNKLSGHQKQYLQEKQETKGAFNNFLTCA